MAIPQLKRHQLNSRYEKAVENEKRKAQLRKLVKEAGGVREHAAKVGVQPGSVSTALGNAPWISDRILGMG